MKIVEDRQKWLEEVDVDYAESCIRMVDFLAQVDGRMFTALLEEMQESESAPSTIWHEEEE